LRNEVMMDEELRNDWRRELSKVQVWLNEVQTEIGSDERLEPMIRKVGDHLWCVRLAITFETFVVDVPFVGEVDG